MIPTPGNLSQPRLPWLNPHVLGLLGKRDEKGERLLEMLHLELLAALSKALPTGEGTVTRAEISAWLGTSHAHTPRRLLADLRRLGLIEYRPEGRGPAAWVASKGIVEIPLGNHIDSPGAEGNLYDSLLSTNGAEGNLYDSLSPGNPRPSPKPPPGLITEGDSLLGTPVLRSARKAKAEDGAARARGEKTRVQDSSAAAPGQVWAELRRRRGVVMASPGLTKREAEMCRQFLAGGGTLGDVDEAIDVWSASGQPAVHSFCYIIRIARDGGDARREFLSGTSRPVDIESDAPAPSPRRRQAATKRLSVDEEADIAFAKWKAKYGSGRDGAGSNPGAHASQNGARQPAG